MRLTLLAGITALITALGPQETPKAFSNGPEIPKKHLAAAILTAKRCATCHPMKRVTRARYLGDEWEANVEEMRRKEKSGISKKEAKTIAAFLAWWSLGGDEDDGGDSTASAPSRKRGPWVAPRHAVVAETPVAADAGFPLEVTVDDSKVTIEKVIAGSPQGGPSLTAHLRIGGQTGLATWAADSDGDESVTGMTVSTWKVGPWGFARVIHIRGVLGDDGKVASFGLVAVVARTNWKSVKIGWSGGAPRPPKAPVPAPDGGKKKAEVCPMGRGR